MTDNDDGLVGKKQQQPGLITADQFRHQKQNAKSNMVYGAQNLRWVNMDALDEQQEKVFDDSPDLVPNGIPRYNPSAPPPSRHAAAGRGLSAIRQRTVSTASSASTANIAAGEEFEKFPKKIFLATCWIARLRLHDISKILYAPQGG